MGGSLTPCSRIVNIAVGVIMVLGGIAQFFPPSMGSIIVGAYVIVFGLRMFLCAVLCSIYRSRILTLTQLSGAWNSCPPSLTTCTATLRSSSPSSAGALVSRYHSLLSYPTNRLQSTSSSDRSCCTVTSCATLPVRLSVSSVSATWLWNSFPRSSPPRTCASPTRAGAPSRSNRPM